MGYILSVDGGGSKTAYCLYETAEKIKIYTKGGSTNYKNIGIEKVRKNIQESLSELLAKGKTELEEIEYFVFGLSGCDTEDDREKFKGILSNLGIEKNFVVLNDAELAFRAISPFDDGAVLVAGTGSIGLAFENNRVLRTGGWGKELSDLGSGYWIGRKYLERYLLYLEDMEEWDISFERMEILGQERQEQIEKTVTAYETTSQIASIAEFVINNQDSPLCMGVLNEAVDGMVKMIKQLCRKIKKEKFILVLSGGVAVNSIVTERIKIQLEKQGLFERLEVVPNLYQPVDGGINIGLNYIK